MSFQCNILSAPIIEGDNILFKSQAIEFNGKNRTEIPITCTCPIQNSRMFSKVNKLQKGNKINVTGNLIWNDEEVTVLINYIVYVSNTSSFSTAEKKDLSKIPWLNSSGIKKLTNENQSQESSSDLPNFITVNNNNREEANETEDIKMADVSDNTRGMGNFYITTFVF